MAIENLITLYFSIDILAIYIYRDRARKKIGRRSGDHQQLLLLLKSKASQLLLLLLLFPACHGSTYDGIMLSLTTLLCKVLCGGPQGPSARRKEKTTKKKRKDAHTHTHTHTHSEIQTHIPDTHTETKERKKGTRKKGHKAKLPTTDCLTDSLRLPLYAIHSFFVVSSIAHF
jgi:hypothetical protein